MAQNRCKCDLYWPRINFCVEYDSDQWHADIEKINQDAKWRNTLTALGITGATVISSQLSGEGVNKLAHLLAKRTNKRLRYRDSAFTRKHYDLRQELFKIDIELATITQS